MLHALDSPKILAKYPKHTCTGPFFDDQRFLNGFFGMGNYTVLDRKWNLATHYLGKPIAVAPDVNIHFTGSHKPNWHMCEHGMYDIKPPRKAASPPPKPTSLPKPAAKAESHAGGPTHSPSVGSGAPSGTTEAPVGGDSVNATTATAAPMATSTTALLHAVAANGRGRVTST
eukprot:7346298-Prymnesium_polylepis.2